MTATTDARVSVSQGELRRSDSVSDFIEAIPSSKGMPQDCERGDFCVSDFPTASIFEIEAENLAATSLLL